MPRSSGRECSPASLTTTRPGITTYSILGADFGYRLLWVLLLSTVALVVFHELGARMGCVTGRGLAGLIRDRYGHRAAASAAAVLLVANVGTTCAEFAGVAAASELAGVSRYASVPVAAILVSTLVVRGGFRRVEHVLLLLATVFVTYFASESSLIRTGARRREGLSFRHCRCSVTRCSSRLRQWARRSHPGGWRSSSRTPSTSGSVRATSRSSAWT